MKQTDGIIPGEIWTDTDGKPIQAHAGGFLLHEGVHYWYGEDKEGKTLSGPDAGCGYRVDVIGIRCYSSRDLVHWNNEGLVLPAVPDQPEHDLHPSNVLERPKVVWNRKTQRFVMWIHVDDTHYRKASAGVAVSLSPTGPFTYLGSIRPNGADSRDMTLYEEEGKAWLIHSSEQNKTLYVSELTDDFLDVTGTYTRNFIGSSREAPALFKRGSRYFLITSGCTGWDPNEAEYAVSDRVMGPWTVMGNPCVGEGAETTFRSQGTYVIQVSEKEDRFIFAADRHRKEDLADSRYIWLPMGGEGDLLQIGWRDSWRLENVGGHENAED